MLRERPIIRIIGQILLFLNKIASQLMSNDLSVWRFFVAWPHMHTLRSYQFICTYLQNLLFRGSLLCLANRTLEKTFIILAFLYTESVTDKGESLALRPSTTTTHCSLHHGIAVLRRFSLHYNAACVIAKKQNIIVKGLRFKLYLLATFIHRT